MRELLKSGLVTCELGSQGFGSDGPGLLLPSPSSDNEWLDFGTGVGRGCLEEALKELMELTLEGVYVSGRDTGEVEMGIGGVGRFCFECILVECCGSGDCAEQGDGHCAMGGVVGGLVLLENVVKKEGRG